MEYILCTTPRVGSNLLCAMLSRTRTAGYPGEYFATDEMARRMHDLDGVRFEHGVPVDFQEYYDRCRKMYTTESGHFGFKAHSNQLGWALEKGFQFEPNMPTRFVHLTRADVTGQAISYARALQTGSWHAQEAAKAAPVFDANAIRDGLELIRRGNEGWERLFHAYGIQPYRLSYEQFSADLAGEFGGVLDYLEVDRSSIDLRAIEEHCTAAFKKQRDTTTDEWRRLWAKEVRKNAAVRESKRLETSPV